MVWSVPGRVVRSGGRLTADALGYVRSLPELGTTLLLGGLLWGYGVWLVVPGLLVMGYFVRVLRHVPPHPGERDVTPSPPRPPRFDRWLGLFVDGVRVYVVWTVYLFLAFTAAIPYGPEGASARVFVLLLRTLLGNVEFLLSLREALGVGPTATTATAGGFGALVDPGVALFVVSMYVAPAALLNVAARGTLRAGFALDELHPVLVSRTYAGRWGVFVLLWLASTVVLYLPGTWLAAAVVPDGLPTLAAVVRESVELLRGVVSFGLLGLGYVVLGRVTVPPTDTLSVRRLADVVYGTRLGALVRGDAGAGFGRTLLVAGLLAAFWSFPAVVLLAGYLVRFVRALGAGEPPPRFDHLGGLVVDGARATALWVGYAVPPVALLVAWWVATPLPVDARLLTALTGLAGLGLGAWYLGRDAFTVLSGSTWAPTPTVAEPALLLAAFAAASLVTLYVYPAAVVAVARDRRLLAGVDPRSLRVVLRRPGYVGAWARGVAFLAGGAALSLSWNWWRLGQPGADTESLVVVAGVTVVSLPTGVGILSSLYLLVVSVVGALLLFRAYGGIAAAAAPPATETERREADD